LKLNKRIYKKVFVAGILLASLILLVFASRAFCYPAEVEDIGGDKYFLAAKGALQDAKSSIYMVMYYVSFDSRDKNSSVYQLAQELVNAHKRGVKVKVILDQNIPYASWEGRGGDWQVEGKNESMFIYLKKEGIDAYYDNKTLLTHSKVIVIDEEKVIIGSANWTVSSLHRNYEASVLIKSPKLAQGLIKDFSRIIIDYEASILDEEKKAPVRVSRVFIEDPSLTARMLSKYDAISFDTYLLLLRDFNGNPEGEIDFDFKRMSEALGLDEKQSHRMRVKKITNALKRLHERYKLIERKARPKKNPYIRLLNYPDKIPYQSPEDKFFSVPDDYWRYGWHRRLSFPEKYCYFINLSRTGIGRSPWWAEHIVALENQYNVNEATISRGMMGLRKLNIIDIEYSDYTKEGYVGRGPARFRLLGLYSPEKLEEQVDRLKVVYGEGAVSKSRAYAKIVYKENDIQVIEDIIKKTAMYGEDKINRAFTIVSKKAPDNPKRSYKYVVGILQKHIEE